MTRPNAGQRDSTEIDNPPVQAAGTVSASPDVERNSDVAPATGLEDRLRRALADADNLRKRSDRQVADARSAERARVAAAWLPIVDNLELALEHAGGSGDPVVDGVRAVRDQAVSVLMALGYPRHDETGVPFDPQRHEAVSVTPSEDAPSGTVIQVLRPGYGEGSAQIRPAAVVVAGGPG